ncbi:6-phosphogluconolactonase [Enterovibrio norvegicus]|uniref:lactonase family protein n=1 Tax=Enterovibrio norvegicus TaxID=188144 RepID=UPI00031D9854|nr:lactonase family protein [Enterovibrio norvegicus]OEE47069.1 6-phosphogluconolactonase [Enterovibrio norvegicus]
MTVTHRLLIGSYTQPMGAIDGEGEGILAVDLDAQTGAFSAPNLVSRCENPSYVTVAGEHVFAVTEFARQEGASIGLLTHRDGNINEVSSVAIEGDYPCHVAVNAAQNLVVASNYGSGSFSVYCLEQGSLTHFDTVQHKGVGANRDRQEAPHAHFAQFLATSNTLVTVDLGTDRVSFYPFSDTQLDRDNAQHVIFPPGSGQRHLVFNQQESLAYVLCELSEEVTVLERKDDGVWTIVQAFSPFDKHNEGGAAAAIRLSNDEEYLYVSGRQQNVICVLKIENSNTLALQQTVGTNGINPRDFNLSRDGDWLVVANQNTSNLVSYRVDKTTGLLSPSGYEFATGNPVCIALLC